MAYFAVRGGRPLAGEVPVHGSKNSALPMLAATLLARGESVLHNCPALSDIDGAACILSALGCKVRREGSTLLVNTACRSGCAVPPSLMGRMRASVLFLGALLASAGEAAACSPGGCALGARPIDLHLEAFRLLGAEVLGEGESLLCRCAGLRGRSIHLPFPSVGATENIMLAACGAEGVTEIHNAAREPEIEDLQGFLRSMGAKVSGGGTGCITIEGGRPLHPAEYTVMPDRIVAATYLAAAAAAGGEAVLRGARPQTLRPVIGALLRAGCCIAEEADRLILRRTDPLRGIGRVETRPYPGFPTDAQPLLAAALAAGRGETTIVETIFDRRFRYTEGLRRMGADIRVQGNTARITGVEALRGTEVHAADLRGGAALTAAALAAEGESRIYGLEHIDRGYEALASALSRLGGDIRRVETD